MATIYKNTLTFIFLVLTGGLTSSSLYAGEMEILNRDLHLAVTKNDLKLAEELLEQGADPDSKVGYTPLMSIVTGNRHYPDMISLLINYGANVNLPGNGNGTPLQYARYADIAKLLLDAGADVNEMTSGGATPLYGVITSYNESYSYLSNRDDDSRFMEVVELLLERGADPNILSNRGTPLHIASSVPRHGIDILKLLLKYGADINAKSGYWVRVALAPAHP